MRIKVLRYLIHRKFPQFQQQMLPVEWSLFEDTESLLAKMLEKKEWLEQENASLDSLKRSLNSPSSMTKYNQRISLYNQKKEALDDDILSLKRLLEKYQTGV